MRSKIEYVVEAGEKGKSVPKKLGTKPIQRDNVEYEFTTVFDVQNTHKASVSKDRTGLFADAIFQITEDTGAKLREWLKGGVSVESVNEEQERHWITKINAMRAKINDKKKLAKVDDAIKGATSIKALESVAKRLEATVQVQ